MEKQESTNLISRHSKPGRSFASGKSLKDIGLARKNDFKCIRMFATQDQEKEKNGR
jgi:hypothetical protein